MTLYLTFEAIENNKLNAAQELQISARGEEISKVNKSNSLHLKEGDKITVRQAIDAVIVKSFNEAAVVLAEAVAGDEWNFARLMNQKAAELGMINTSFHNSSGLHEEGQYTTAYDLARLAKAIKKDFPKYYYLFALKKFDYEGAKYKTHNHVLVDYKGAEGMKTGFTKASGFNLISAAKKDGERIISILLGCATFQSRDALTKNLLDKSFAKLKQNQNFNANLAGNFSYENDDENSDTQSENLYFVER
jgi:D-alanyl-D-alanine carboxypeptidase